MSITLSIASASAPAPAPTLQRLTRSIGAVIRGVDLGEPLTSDVAQFVADAVTEHQVVFVRDQDLTAAQLHDLASTFGALTVHPVDQVAGTPKGVTTISDTASRPPAEFDWHTDLSWTAEPPSWGFLHAVEIPATGGDTMWASGFAMYERLGERLRHFCERRHAIHRPSCELIGSVRRHRGDEVAIEVLRRFPPVAHPLVRHHPVSGRPALWLSPLYMTQIEAMSSADSAALLDVLHRGIEDPDVQVRWRWRDGDVAIWDERSTVHRALGDHFPQTRVMRRCTID